MRVVLEGLAIGESPRWHDGRLWFCNWGPDELVAMTPDGECEVVALDPSVRPHSIEWLPDGRMLVVPKDPAHQGLLLRVEPGGEIVVHADLRPIAAGWNEIVVDGLGNVYVNGSDFDFLGFLKGGVEFVPGVIALVTPDGEVRKVADGIEFGNGMVVTPDNATLVVAESFAGRLTAFDIGPGGSLSGRRVWAEGMGPDGITIDAEGAIWTSSDSMAGNCVRIREGGEVLERLELDRSPFACMLGGPDRRTLYVMAAEWHPEDPFGDRRTGQVLAVDAPSPGVGWP
ncbi:SMP-30/gluconolactonase/LRE family protein [Actinomycetes bacterium KLBMP 9759]